MKGYKGFDKDLKCRGMQYAIGETFTYSGTLSLCNSGLHFVENPLDALSYYAPGSNRYAEVDADAVLDKTGKDSKRVAKSLRLTAELKIPALVKAAVRFVIEKKDATTGNSSHAATTGDSSHAAPTGHYSHAATTGNYSHAATTGYYSHAATTGYSSHAATTGKESISAAFGRNGSAKGPIGGWLVLSEIDDNSKIKAVGVARVDGKKIKADTFYKIKNGKFVEVR